MMTTEVRSMTQKLCFVFWLTPLKVATEPKVRHQNNVLIKQHWMLYLLFNRDQNQGWPWGQGETHMRSWLELGRSSCISVDLRVRSCHLNGAFLNSLSKFHWKFGLYHLCCKINNSNILDFTHGFIMGEGGHMTNLTQDDWHLWKYEIERLRWPGIGSIEKLQQFVTLRRMVPYEVIDP